MTLSPGSRLGPYQIESALGAGGMGEVYKARDTRLDRLVAIKILPPHLAGDTQFRERFDREARALSALRHRHICTLHDVGRVDDHDYLVMELLEGEALAQRLEQGALPLEQALAAAIQIADALAAAHRSGIVHRDLKPQNIFFARGSRGTSEVNLLDFGIARHVGAAPSPALSPHRLVARCPAGAPSHRSTRRRRMGSDDGVAGGRHARAAPPDAGRRGPGPPFPRRPLARV